MHGVYLGGVFVAIRLGLEAGLSALIVGLQPLLVAAAAPLVLAERVSARTWLGLALGLAGVALVLARKLGLGSGDALAALACLGALAGITIGTLYQKRFCGAQDLRTGNLIQFAAAGAACWLLALLFETTPHRLGARARVRPALAGPGALAGCDHACSTSCSGGAPRRR